MEVPRILPLAEHVVQRIAAGEVIQRPFSAVKELIENSVDANATLVTVTVKGSSALIQVQDNGTGIHPDDLLLVCKRFNTSKLRQFEDLKNMTTYGFRGEALSSITHVAKVTITTQKPNQNYSVRASYKDGSLVSKPTKCAGIPGTTITVEDLFYNVPQRLRALKSAGEEYSKIMEIVQKYAILHSGKVGFICKRAGVHSPDVNTLNSSNVKENIMKIYGSDVARELIEFECEPVANILVSMNGVVTNPNYSRKKEEFLLFINGRLVECTSLKRVVDACYSECLPKGGHPFVFLSLQLPPENIDVNVHPTKREVQFLNDDEIYEILSKKLKELLLGGNDSRVFETSKVNTALFSASSLETPPSTSSKKSDKTIDADDSDIEDDQEIDDFEKQEGSKQREKKRSRKKNTPAPNKLIRTDSQVGSGIDRFVTVSSKCCEDEAERKEENSAAKATVTPLLVTEPCDILNEDLENATLIVPNSDALELLSIKMLIENMNKEKSNALCDCLRRSVFVGVVDRNFSLIQYDTSLVAVHHVKLCRDLFYQRILTLFGRFRSIPLTNPPSIVALLKGNETQTNLLLEKSELLYEYFGVDLRGGNLKAIPRLVNAYSPLPRAIPRFIRRLTTKVVWDDELLCFQSIAKEIAIFYAELPEFRPLITTDPSNLNLLPFSDRNSLQYILKNVLFPAIKSSLIPSLELFDSSNGYVIQLAKLEQLYRVFERC